MTTDPLPTGPAAPDPGDAIARARDDLRDARAALTSITGGAAPRAVLAELAQGLAVELAEQFDDLPMWRFTGRVPRLAGPLGVLLPSRGVQHRLVLARYISSTVPMSTGNGYNVLIATIALLAIGADGVLRRGRRREQVVLPEGTSLEDAPLEWDDMRLRRFPSGSQRLTRWNGTADAFEVASPAEVLDALTKIGAVVVGTAQRDASLLRKLLAPSK